MKKIKRILIFTIASLFALTSITFSTTKTNISKPTVTSQIFKQAQNNANWKLAFFTGKHGQIVFMNVTPQTNPNNEIGMETHPFDQVILIVQGNGKAVLNGKEFPANAGDMIFIPEGTAHNIINTKLDKALKVISFYSDTDIPAKSAFKTKADEPHESK